MNAGDARLIAESWVAEEASRTPGEILGAFTWGSVNWMAAEEPFPVSSDVDLAVVVPRLDTERHRVRKRAYRGLILEPFYLPRERFLSTETLLADCAVAPNLVDGTVLLDPAGTLQSLRAAMAPELGRRHWVRLRCRDRRQQALSLIAAFEASDSLTYVNGVLCHAVMGMAQMALIADLRNPTVKKALVKARDVLASYGLGDEHGTLLRLLGVADLRDEDVLAVSSHCRAALEEACRWFRTAFPPDNHVSVHSLAALDLDVPACVKAGRGREIFLWVASLYAFAMIAILNDGPEAVAAAAKQVYLADMAHMHAATLADARARMLACRPALQRMTDLSDDIVSRNPRAFA
jgi:hypothetical protein